MGWEATDIVIIEALIADSFSNSSFLTENKIQQLDLWHMHDSLIIHEL